MQQPHMWISVNRFFFWQNIPWISKISKIGSRLIGPKEKENALLPPINSFISSFCMQQNYESRILTGNIACERLQMENDFAHT